MRAQANQTVSPGQKAFFRAEEILEHVPSSSKSPRPAQSETTFFHRLTGAMLPISAALALNPDLVIQQSPT